MKTHSVLQGPFWLIQVDFISESPMKKCNFYNICTFVCRFRLERIKSWPPSVMSWSEKWETDIGSGQTVAHHDEDCLLAVLQRASPIPNLSFSLCVKKSWSPLNYPVPSTDIVVPESSPLELPSRQTLLVLLGVFTHSNVVWYYTPGSTLMFRLDENIGWICGYLDQTIYYRYVLYSLSTDM